MSMFQEFGEIESVHVARDESGKQKDYGYVNFKDHNDAEKALDAMNKKELPGGQFLMVNRHISKKENELMTPGSSIHPIS